MRTAGDVFAALDQDAQAKRHLTRTAELINDGPFPDTVKTPADLAFYVRDKGFTFPARFAAMIVAALFMGGAGVNERWGAVFDLIKACDDYDGLVSVSNVLSGLVAQLEALEELSAAQEISGAVMAMLGGFADGQLIELQLRDISESPPDPLN